MGALFRIVHAVLDPLINPLLRLWKSEPIRLLYVVAVGLQAFATLSTGGQPLQAVLQGVFLAILGEAQRQGVFAPDTVQAIANGATNLPAGTVVDIGSPPAGDTPPAGG